MVDKGERVGTVKKAVKRIADEAGVPEVTQRTVRAFMATHVRKMCRSVKREYRSIWLGHTVKEGSQTTDFYEEFDVDLLADVALATDFVISELQKLCSTQLFAIEVRLTKTELRRLGEPPVLQKPYRTGG
ncbi:hypothetical protein BH10PSE8_BH10PSE8_09240 [soil metagenome]